MYLLNMHVVHVFTLYLTNKARYTLYLQVCSTLLRHPSEHNLVMSCYHGNDKVSGCGNAVCLVPLAAVSHEHLGLNSFHSHSAVHLDFMASTVIGTQVQGCIHGNGPGSRMYPRKWSSVPFVSPVRCSFHVLNRFHIRVISIAITYASCLHFQSNWHGHNWPALYRCSGVVPGTWSPITTPLHAGQLASNDFPQRTGRCRCRICYTVIGRWRWLQRDSRRH